MLYRWVCKECRAEVERVCDIADRDKQRCNCGGELHRVFTPPQVMTFRPRFFDVAEQYGGGFHASSRSDLKAKLEARGLIHKSYGWRHDYESPGDEARERELEAIRPGKEE